MKDYTKVERKGIYIPPSEFQAAKEIQRQREKQTVCFLSCIHTCKQAWVKKKTFFKIIFTKFEKKFELT